jgi:hypothetical protein
MLAQDVKELADGSVAVALEDGAGTALTSTLVSAKQALDVNIANSIDVGTADKTTFTYGTSIFQPVGGVFQDTSPGLTAGQSGAQRLTANRAGHVNLRNSSGAELGDSTADALFVRPGDGTNAQSFTAAGEVKAQITQPLPAGTNQIGHVVVDNAGALIEATATLTLVAGSASSVSILAANANRKGFILVNDNNTVAKMAFAATATATAYTLKMQPNSVYESPERVYTGAISAIWNAAGTGNGMVITELT